MERYDWTVTVGGRTPKHGSEDDPRAAIEIVQREAASLRQQNIGGWWVRVWDTTKPVMSYNPPMIGWRIIYFDYDPRPFVDEPETTVLKNHLSEKHRLVEGRGGVTVHEDEIVYMSGAEPAMLQQLHEWAHTEREADHSL